MSSQPISNIVPGEPLIRFEDVSISFDEGEILRGISFGVLAGETKVILGESGSGKTVLLKLAAGLLRPQSGRVIVMGHDLTEMNEVELLDFRRRIGFVFQEGALFDSLNVAENVSFRLDEESVSPEETEPRVREALRFVEMEESYDKFPDEPSRVLCSTSRQSSTTIRRPAAWIQLRVRPSSRSSCACAT